MNLVLSSQERLGGLHIDVGDYLPSDVLRSILTSDEVQSALTDAIRDILAGTAKCEWTSTLYEAGVTARDGRYAQLIGWLDAPREAEAAPKQTPPESIAHQNALRYTAALGQGQAAPVWVDYPTLEEAVESDLEDGPLAVLAAGDVTPTIAARIDKDTFAQRPRDQRETTLRLLATLTTQCDIHLVCTRLTVRWLADNHRTDLPIDSDEQLNTTRDRAGPTENAVADAFAALDPDGGPVELLRVLADEPTQTVPQAALPSELCRDASTVSRYLNQLEALTLVERYSVGAGNHVTLKHPGEAYLDELDAEIGRQQRLDRQFADIGHRSKRPCNHAHVKREGGRPSNRQPQPPRPLTATAPPPHPTARGSSTALTMLLLPVLGLME